MRLRTLGGLALSGSAFSRPKPLLLLAYLALEGPSERARLARLFWPRAKNPAGSLAVAVSQLRRAGPDLLFEESGRLGTAVATDAEALASALAARDWQGVRTLYRGPFLAGVRLELGPELEEWLFSEREKYARWVAEAALALAEAALAEGALERVRAFAEEAQRRLGEVGLRPTRRVTRLLRASGSPLAPRGRSTPCRLPRGLPPLVGRQAEVEDLAARLASGGARLLVLVGLGGVGKTRLAAAVATRLCRERAFPDGVFWAAAGEGVGPTAAIAEGLELPPDPDRVARALAKRRVLLVLDDFDAEHPEAGRLPKLLAAAPGLAVLATARTRLGLSLEQVYPLSGLGLATGPEGRSEAARLFFQRAGDLGAKGLEAREVEAFCREVGGHPLAILLAASWADVLPPGRIAERLVQGGELPPRLRDLPSLNRVLEESYALLDERQRRVFRGLGAFAPSFRAEDAEAVVPEATPAVLAGLADRAMLTQSRDRLGLHPLIRSLARRHLSARPEEARALALRHARRFLGKAGASPWLPPERLAWMRAELANLDLAWQRAYANGLWSEIARALDPLTLFFDRLGRFAQGLTWFEAALAAGPPERPAAALALSLAWMRIRLGRLEEAAEALRGLPRLDPELSRRRLAILGLLSYRQGRHAEAERRWRKALAGAAPDDPFAHRTRHNLALALFSQGRLEEAEGLLAQVLAAEQAEGNWAEVAKVENNLGNLLRIRGRSREARRLLASALALAREHGLGQIEPFALYNLGQVALAEGKAGEAERRFLEALARVRETGERVLEASCCLNLGHARLVSGLRAEAESWLWRGLRLAAAVGETPEVLRGLLLLAKKRRAEGREEEAGRILATLLRHPALRAHNRTEAERLAEGLVLPPPAPSLAALLRGLGVPPAPPYPNLTGAG